MKLLVIVLSWFLLGSADVMDKAHCLDSATRVSQYLNTSWILARSEQPSRAKDTIYSAWDFSNVHLNLQKRIPGKFDRTKGSYLELRDRLDFAYRYGASYPWHDYNVSRYLVYAYRELCDRLAHCYYQLEEDDVKESYSCSHVFNQ